MELLTDRLSLRRPTEKDLTAVHEVHADPETNRHNPAGPVTEVEQSRRMLQGWIDHWECHGFGYWAVVRPADGRVLGFSGLERRKVAGGPVLNLYYRYRPEAWGAGYATEAARAAREMAETHLAGEELVALVRDTNTPSAHVAERIGLIPDDRTIDYGGVPTLVYRIPSTHQ